MKKMKWVNLILFVACLLAIFQFLSCAEMQTKEKAAVAIEPASGPAKAPFKVTGSGFRPGEEIMIVLHLEGVRIALGNRKDDMILADSTGAFMAESAIPSVAKPGSYLVEVVGNKGSKVTTSLGVEK